MKKLMMVVAMALTATLMAQDKPMSLADARGKIGDVIANPASMTQVMKQLSADDQTKFLADVNAAIAKMPGSAEEKTAKYLDVDSAALKGAQKGNLTALVAEVYATVPPESLTVVNERFAENQFSRSADPSRSYSDEEYTKISKSLLNKVEERTASTGDAGVRNTFAILMLLRASGGSPADLRDTLVAELDDPATRKLAQEEWISPALGQGQEKTYDPMLGAADAGDAPKPELAMEIVAYPDALAALMGDLASECSIASPADSLTALLAPAFDNPSTGIGVAALDRLPRSQADVPYNPGYRRGDTVNSSASTVIPVRPVRPVPHEPDDYPGQSSGRY